MEVEDKGAAPLSQLGPEFLDWDDETKNKNRSLPYFLRYLTPYKSQLTQLVLGMVVKGKQI